jgi:hypothetical protein
MRKAEESQMSEAAEQIALFKWAAYYPELKWMFHIPNGGRRDPREARGLMFQGVKKGVCDILLPKARKGYHGLFIEMKRSDGGTVSKEQKEFIADMLKEGYYCEICHGFESAKRVIEWYMGMA